ncbi:MAG: hypothetical protein EBR82_45595 [Caulobacteraceae bacterium]|nr:hypothetical protein [Caulobacteraceae bacterium]
MIDPALTALNKLVPIIEIDYQGGPGAGNNDASDPSWNDASGFKVQVMVGSPLNLGNSTTLQDAAFPNNPVNSKTITATLNIKKYMFSAQASMTADEFTNVQNSGALQTGDIGSFLQPYILDDWTRQMTSLPFSRNQGCVAEVEAINGLFVTFTETSSILELFINLGGPTSAAYSGGPTVELGAELCFTDTSNPPTIRGTAYLRSFNPNTRQAELSAIPSGLAVGDRVYYRNPFAAPTNNTRPYSVRDLADAASYPSLFGCDSQTWTKFRPQNKVGFGAWNEVQLYKVLNRIPAQNGSVLDRLDICLHMDTMAKAKATLLNKVGRTAYTPGEMNAFNLNLPQSSILDRVGETPVNWIENAMMARGEFVGLGQIMESKFAGIPLKANVKEFPMLPAGRVQFPNLKQLNFVPLTQGGSDTIYRLPSTLTVRTDAIAYLQHVTVGEGRRFLSLVTGVDYLNSFSD